MDTASRIRPVTLGEPRPIFPGPRMCGQAVNHSVGPSFYIIPRDPEQRRYAGHNAITVTFVTAHTPFSKTRRKPPDERFLSRA
jgi:hypothetical protein